MIKLYLMSELGNQMFQYAFVRALAEKNHESIVINTDCLPLFNRSIGRNQKGRVALIHLKLNGDTKIVSNKMKALEYFLRYAFDSFFTKPTGELFEKRARKGKIIQTTKDTWEYYKIPESNKKDKNVIGYYINEKYFSNIEPILKDEFEVVTPPSKQNVKMISEISSCNSVCVHIRRGDYLLKKNAFLNVTNEQYYKNAMKYIAENTIAPIFYVFSNTSDDIQWIKENYHFEYPVRYVELNNPDYEELRLMYNCKHFIICNSTFSWWGAYLSKNQDKIVVAPEKIQATFDKMIKI